MKKFSMLITLVIILSGCATIGKSDSSSTQPEEISIQNELILNENFDTIWDRLVKRLASGFYVINNIDKSSRIINVSFTSNTPEKYIDCGTTHRTFRRGNEYEEYNYKIAASSNFKMAGAGGNFGQFPITYFLNRRTSLDGRVNIYVAPLEEGTLVTVNCRYILSVIVDGISTHENAFGVAVYSQPLTPSTASITANTNSAGFANWGDYKNPTKIKCISLGVLESEILDYAKP